MRMVAAAKMKRAQEAIESARPYVLKLQEIMQHLVEAAGSDYSNPLSEKRSEIKNVAVICIAADRGLCGSFNANLFKFTENFILKESKQEFPDADLSVIPVGTKSVKHFDKRDFPIERGYRDAFAKLDFADIQKIIRLCTDEFKSGKYDKVLVFFNIFKNILIQKPTRLTLLPIEPPETKEDEEKNNISLDYIYEPEQKAILDELLPKSVDIQFWRTILESNAAEQAARMMAMENATENAKELIRNLEMEFNKKRQEAITTEMLEIVGGANAL